MKGLISALSRVSIWMDNVGGIILILMMLLTVTDVILRLFGRPITGTYELVALAGAMVIGFAIPQTSRENGHIIVDIAIEGRSNMVKNIFFVFTKLLGITLFVLLAWYLFPKGSYLHSKGDVSSTLQIPYYPAAYGLAFCCLIESVVLLMEVFRKFGREVKHE
jgi:TRAP-type C4-dicarboxylate transport system permease small subunit